MKWTRRIRGSRIGSVAAVFASLALIAFAAYSVRSFVHGSAPESAYSTMYICTETGKTFRHVNQLGEVQPIYSPYSGKNTGVPAEACCWTADGKTKKEPTWVLLNQLVGKPGPTFCPDCGRLVVGHNPEPGPNVKPPPTRAEYYARRSAGKPAAGDRE